MPQVNVKHALGGTFIGSAEAVADLTAVGGLSATLAGEAMAGRARLTSDAAAELDYTGAGGEAIAPTTVALTNTQAIDEGTT